MMKIIDEMGATLYYLGIALFAFFGVLLLTAAFPIFIVFGLLKNWRKDNNLLIAMAMITIILWLFIGLQKLYTLY